LTNGALAIGIKRYGLDVNPYVPRALDPLRRPNDAALLTGLDRLEDVRQYITRAADARETAYVLVTGRSGVGRTSVANHLLAHFRDHCEVPAEKFVVPHIRIKGHDDNLILRNWLKKLHGELQLRQLTPISDGGIELDDAIRTGEELNDVATYQTTAALWMRTLSDVLAAKGAGFAVCLENLESYDLIDAALTIFEEAATLVVLTALDYAETRESIRERFLQHSPVGHAQNGPSYPVVELEPLRGGDAMELIQTRWRSATTLVSPFDDDGLAQAFDDKLRPAGRVLRLTQEVLDFKTEAAGEGPLWPHADDLAISAGELRALVSRLDSLLRTEVPRA
jgi:hypothetical protein